MGDVYPMHLRRGRQTRKGGLMADEQQPVKQQYTDFDDPSQVAVVLQRHGIGLLQQSKTVTLENVASCLGILMLAAASQWRQIGASKVAMEKAERLVQIAGPEDVPSK